MAISSLNHSFFGRSTHAAGSASFLPATPPVKTVAWKSSAAGCLTTGPAL
ncbi:hypothetical protein ACVWZV_003173 [Bradyrhizobium sp. GM5.1]